MTAGSRLDVRGLEKAFGRARVLRGVDLRCRPGELVAVVGRSGCGKSTLLRTIAGLEARDRGAVAIDGRAVDGASADTRMIFQEPRLLPWSSVLDNVLLGARAELKARSRSAERIARGRELLRCVGLADRGGDWPGRLSGGQKQRVALARGLMSEPRLLLLDEPLGALDALTRLEMQQLVERLWIERGFTAVLVTHEIQEAVALADRVVVLDEGRVSYEVALTMPRPRARASREFVDVAARLLERVLGRPDAPRPGAPARRDEPGPDDLDASGIARSQDAFTPDIEDPWRRTNDLSSS